MPRTRAAKEGKVEEQVWDQLTRTIACDSDVAFGVTVEGRSKKKPTVKLQIFEVTVAAIFAQLRPDFVWSVKSVSRDGGADFIGTGNFFEDGPLRIQAEITVGGQCKKHKRVDDAVVAIESGMTRMAQSLNPTFFVVALSARLTEKRVQEAVALIVSERRRHCYAFQRAQIERLIHAHLPVLSEILGEAIEQGVLTRGDVEQTLDYFAEKGGHLSSIEISVSTPRETGLPLRVEIEAPLAPVNTKGQRLFWRPAANTSVILLTPLGADQETGVDFAAEEGTPDLTGIKGSLDLVTYTAGEVDLGEVLVGPDIESAQRLPLPSIQVGEVIRPRFYAPPVRAGMARLEKAQGAAMSNGVAAIGVVGGGGSGKSRLCEEFAFDQVRHGCALVSAQQAKVLDEPYRLLWDLFSNLVEDDFEFPDLSERVIQAIERYDAAVAERATPALRAIFGTADQRSGTVTDQNVLAALVILIVARARRGPLIVHLRDLHWCSVDVLLLLENLVRELKRTAASFGKNGKRGVLFIFEGRNQQRSLPGEDEWSSGHFETLLRKLDCPTVTCSAFDAADSQNFVRLLFGPEEVGNKRDRLGAFENDLAAGIARAAGGNPFHTLEQVRTLVEAGVLNQDPRTGFMHPVGPSPKVPELPPEVFDLIQLRWRYLLERTPELALLIWGTALLDDTLPAPLFRRLHEALAPEISMREIDATDILWTDEGRAREVSFRHENYFRSVRQFTVSAANRERVVRVYERWLADRRNPADRFRHARALLALPERDVAGAQNLMRSGLEEARQRGDALLAKRIATTLVDLDWERDDESPINPGAFIGLCDDELRLIRELLGSDRSEAAKRIERLLERLEMRLTDNPEQGADLQSRQLTAQVLRSQVLYNDGNPGGAADVADRAVAGIRALRRADPVESDPALAELEMEGLHAQGSALALSGEIDQALAVYEGAVGIAEGSASALSHTVVSTYANVLLARAPAEAVDILRGRLEKATSGGGSGRAKQSIEINLGMALLLRAHEVPELKPEALPEARELLAGVYSKTTRVGRFPTASAAALLLGIVDALEGGNDALSWFTEAVIAAARGHKIETLWRARINLAAALHAEHGEVTDAVRDNARSALGTMEDTLAAFAEPDESPRFELIRLPMAQAVSFLVKVGDEAAETALVRYPRLRDSFADVTAGTLREEPPEERSHEWLRIGNEHYVIY